MNKLSQKFQKNLEKIKFFSLFLISLFIFLNCFFFECKLFSLSFFLNVFLIFLVSFIFKKTKKSEELFIFLKESSEELKKVVWLSYKDTLKTTFVVFLVTIFMSTVLWGIDGILFYVISFVIKLGL